MRSTVIPRLLALFVILSASSFADDEAPRAESDPKSEAAETPRPFDPAFHAIDPSRLQRLFDEIVGLPSGNVSNRPRAPEMPEPIFFDLTRPLGDLKYSNELNYLLNTNTRNAPTLQVIEYEYTFADWRAAELDLSYFNGSLEILTPFYQRTLGVGRNRNWVHGYQVSLDLYLKTGFVGGSPVYIFSWKPEEDSRFATTIFLGANRALIGGFNPPSMNLPNLPGSTMLDDHPFGAWRPTINVDVFYKLTEKFTFGVETDLFIHSGKAGEYLSFPFLTYEPGEHAFFQFGAGYYEFESHGQFTVFAHLNFVNRSKRKNREPESDDKAEADSESPRWFSRLLGDR